MGLAPTPPSTGSSTGSTAGSITGSGADPTKQTFRKDADESLDAEIDAATGDLDLDAMMSQSAEAADVSDRLSGLQAGTVVSVDLGSNELLVDLGGKHQAIVPLKQFEQQPEVGEFVEVEIEKFDAGESLYRANKKGSARSIGGIHELKQGMVVEATVVGVNKGGLDCRVGPTAIRAFMPAGQVDTTFHKDISIFLDQKFPVRVTKLNKAERNVIVSRRAILEAEKGEAKAKLMRELTEGTVLTGTVKSVKDFGAFIDLGGADGLLHVSQLTHKRMAKAEDHINVGDEVEVRVDKIEKGTGKIALSLSHRPPNPWESAETQYPVGTSVTGTVTRVENFGAFVEVEEGLEGLLPTSEMSWKRIRHPSEVTNVGEQLRLMVIQVQPKARKLTLSLKQIGGDPWSEATSKYAPGSVHEATVTRTADFGAFAELETGVEGLIHISELANNRVRRTEDVVNVGQKVNARVLDVDLEKRRIRLSLKERDERAEQMAAEDVEKRKEQKQQRQKRLSKKPLRGGLDF